MNLLTSKEDFYFMNEALKEAKKAFSKDEVPIGAVLVHNKKIISRGYNQVEMLKDATAHAEMICLTAASNYFNDWRLEDTTLYCTVEPCCMCAGAMLSSRIKRLVWATEDIRVGANGSWINILEGIKHPIHEIIVEKGILKDQASFLMKSFFEKQRSKKCC